MIIRALKTIQEVFIPKSELIEEKIECSIDEENVDCKELQNQYVGVPAPVISPSDEWFDQPVVTEKGQDYMVQETEFKRQEMEKVEERKASGEVVEPDNIHEVMYQMATKSTATTLQLDPIGGSENFQGGSENFHER